MDRVDADTGEVMTFGVPAVNQGTGGNIAVGFLDEDTLLFPLQTHNSGRPAHTVLRQDRRNHNQTRMHSRLLKVYMGFTVSLPGNGGSRSAWKKRIGN